MGPCTDHTELDGPWTKSCAQAHEAHSDPGARPGDATQQSTCGAGVRGVSVSTAVRAVHGQRQQVPNSTALLNALQKVLARERAGHVYPTTIKHGRNAKEKSEGKPRNFDLFMPCLKVNLWEVLMLFLSPFPPSKTTEK